jgi:GTP-binding protein
VVRASDDTNFTVADIPGLVEGAAEGKGLGHRFLRHITRSRVLVVLVELEPVTGIAPGEQLRVLLDELGRYQPDLLERPRVVVGSKADMVGTGAAGPGAGEAHADDDGAGPFTPDLVISAVTGLGIPELVGRLTRLVAEARAVQPEEESSIVIHRPLPEGFAVERIEAGEYRVVGRVAERAVALNDLTTDEAADYVQGRLRRIGVDRALARAGAQDGDVVHIGAMSFVWYRDQPEFTGQPASRRKRT